MVLICLVDFLVLFSFICRLVGKVSWFLFLFFILVGRGIISGLVSVCWFSYCFFGCFYLTRIFNCIRFYKYLIFYFFLFIALFYSFYILILDWSFFTSFLFNNDCLSSATAISSSRVFSIWEGDVIDREPWLGDMREPLVKEVFDSVFQQDLLAAKNVGDFIKQQCHRRVLGLVAVSPQPLFGILPGPNLSFFFFEKNYIHVPKILLLDEDYASIYITLKFVGKPTLEEIHQGMCNKVWTEFLSDKLKKGFMSPTITNYSYFWTYSSKTARSLAFWDRDTIDFFLNYPKLVQEAVWAEVVDAKRSAISKCYRFWDYSIAWGTWEGKLWWETDHSLSRKHPTSFFTFIFEVVMWLKTDFNSAQWLLFRESTRGSYYGDFFNTVVWRTDRNFHLPGPKLDLKGADFENHYTPNVPWIKWIRENLLYPSENWAKRDREALALEVREKRRDNYKVILESEQSVYSWVDLYKKLFGVKVRG